MADTDLLRPRGVPYAAVVDATGTASGGTSSATQLAARGIRAICQVDATGLASSDGTSTVAVLASRGLLAFAAVDENGVSTDDAVSTADVIRRRGIRPMVPVNANGIAATGSATMLTLAQRGLDYFCPVDESGTAVDLTPVPPNTIRARAGIFTFTGETMTPIAGYSMTAQMGAFALAGQSATLTPPALSGPTVTYIGHVVPTGVGTTTLTATAAPIGNPTYLATRRVLVVQNGGAGGGCFITGGSIGGVALDQYTGEGNIATQNDGVDVFSAVVPTGTTANIVVNFNSTLFGSPHFMVFNADNALMSAVDNIGNNPKLGQQENGSGTGLNTATVNTTTKAGGFILAGVWCGGAAGPSITASTETYTVDYSSSANMVCHANTITSNAANSLSTQGPPAGGTSFLAMAAFK